MSTNAPYFAGLDGLRGICAITVVIWHLNQFLPILFNKPVVFVCNDMAELSVIVFFVLSGFLITYLLLEEKKCQTINIRNFYFRRILRIWPLYYLVVFLATVSFPYYHQLVGNPLGKNEFIKTIAFYCFLLPNLGNYYNLSLTPLRPLWSIGVEEQFYLIWPILLKYSNDVFRTIIYFIIGFFLLKLGFRLLPILIHSQDLTYYSILERFPVYIMAIGGMGGVLVQNESVILDFIYSKKVQVLVFSIFILSFINPIPFSINFLKKEVYACLFTILVMNVATNKACFFTFRNSISAFLGKISYSLYVLHLPILLLLSFCITSVFMTSANLLCFLLFIVVTISSLSYFLYEKFFLDLKRNYKPKISGKYSF